MNTPNDLVLLLDLAQAGIEIEVCGERIRYRPQDAMTPKMAQQLKQSKPALLSFLRANLCDEELFHKIMLIVFARINAAWPAGFHMTDSDWSRMDVIEARLIDSKHCGDLSATIMAAADYELMARSIFRRTLKLREACLPPKLQNAV